MNTDYTVLKIDMSWCISLRGRLVHGFLESGMGFVQSKPIPDVWLGKKKSDTHTLNPQGMGF